MTREDRGFDIPADSAPTVVEAADLMETPEGLVRRGDEFHDPRNWKCCRACRVECPRTSTTCFNCGARL